MEREEDRDYQRSMNRTARQDLFGEAQNTEGQWEQRLLGRGDGQDLVEYRADKKILGTPKIDMRGKSRTRLDVRTGTSLIKGQRAEDEPEAKRGLRQRPQVQTSHQLCLLLT
jgi:type V secretory pathway adhesin AidA